LVTLADVTRNETLRQYVVKANRVLQALGYTEHGERHVLLVARIAHALLTHLDHPQREAELAAIAGYLHDVGNLLGRAQHGQSSALLVAPILRDMGLPEHELADVLAAIANHEEEGGAVISNVSAALILADKSDVHRTRVQNPDPENFDIHDRVNYSVTSSFLRVLPKERELVLELTLEADTSVMDYFEIFIQRMLMCRRAAEHLGQRFVLSINEQRLL
jgi:metal-dependent HD superfamily phosphatase/phosphodiesterase